MDDLKNPISPFPEIPQKKSTFLKRFWWVGLLMIVTSVVIIVFMSNSNNKQGITPLNDEVNIQENNKNDVYSWATKFSDAELEAANAALSQGIKINDPENDFYHPPIGSVQADGRPDNPNPYPIPFTDLKSLTVGADAQYIYVKLEHWGEFPLQAYSYEGELIHGVGSQIENFTYTNQSGITDIANLAISIIYVDKKQGQKPEEYKPLPEGRLLNSYYLSPQGVDETLETVYEKSGTTGLVFGGPGYNYVIAAYPLSILDIAYGTEVTFNCTMESGSTTFHHEAADFILEGSGNAKSGADIKYILGSNKYENLGVPENMEKNK